MQADSGLRRRWPGDRGLQAVELVLLRREPCGISEVCPGGIEIPPELAPPGEAIVLPWAHPLGVVHVARAL
jgi:hypothetical protein